MQWVDDEDYDRDKIVHFSLLNQEIVEFDYRYFVEQNPQTKEIYKPYYYGLDIYVDSDVNHCSNNALKNIFKNQLEEGGVFQN